jgi:hypothetical protein
MRLGYRGPVQKGFEMGSRAQEGSASIPAGESAYHRPDWWRLDQTLTIPIDAVPVSLSAADLAGAPA